MSCINEGHAALCYQTTIEETKLFATTLYLHVLDVELGLPAMRGGVANGDKVLMMLLGVHSQSVDA